MVFCNSDALREIHVEEIGYLPAAKGQEVIRVLPRLRVLGFTV